MDMFGWSIALFLLGLAFLIAEFFLPSAGILGLLAALSFVGAVVLAFLAGPYYGFGLLLSMLVIVPAALLAAVRYWPETPIGRRILIQPPQHAEEVLPATEGYRVLRTLVGKRGISKSLMLPSGAVQIDDRTYDALSEGLTIESGQPILVVGVNMQRLIVRLDDSPIRAEFATDYEPLSPLAQEIPDPFAE
jgi:membrane-bound ClpP family serine protease